MELITEHVSKLVASIYGPGWFKLAKLTKLRVIQSKQAKAFDPSPSKLKINDKRF